MTSHLLLLLLGEDVVDGSEAKRTVCGIIEIGEEGSVENKLWDGQGVLLSGYDVFEFVLLWEGVSALSPGKVVGTAGLDGADLGSCGDGVADLIVIDNEGSDLDNWLYLFGLILGADNVLWSNVLFNIVSQSQVDTWDLDTDGLLGPVSWLELEDVLNSLSGQELVECRLGQNEDGVLVLTIGL